MTQPTLAELRTALAVVRKERQALEDANYPNCYSTGTVVNLLLAEANFLYRLAALCGNDAKTKTDLEPGDRLSGDILHVYPFGPNKASVPFRCESAMVSNAISAIASRNIPLAQWALPILNEAVRKSRL